LSFQQKKAINLPNVCSFLEDFGHQFLGKRIQTLEFVMNEAFIGEIVEAYADIQKINSIVFSMHDNNYWKVGEHLARTWNVGKELKF